MLLLIEVAGLAPNGAPARGSGLFVCARIPGPGRSKESAFGAGTASIPRQPRLILTSVRITQRFVLAEAIKTSSIPLQVLMQMLEEYRFQPRWDEICLPPGKLRVRPLV